MFNVFIANLPQLLDQNHVMGWVMTPPVLAILQHCPCPPQGMPPSDHQTPAYSLWYLEPQNRRSWLMALLVILYKVTRTSFSQTFFHSFDRSITCCFLLRSVSVRPAAVVQPAASIDQDRVEHSGHATPSVQENSSYRGDGCSTIQITWYIFKHSQFFNFRDATAASENFGK